VQFKYKQFTCEVDLFQKEKDIILRFYDGLKEHSEEQIVNYVVPDSGYGFLCLKYKGDGCLLSGCLDQSVFGNEEIVGAAIELLEQVSPECNYCYMPYHIDLIKPVDYVEYNGET